MCRTKGKGRGLVGHLVREVEPGSPWMGGHCKAPKVRSTSAVRY